MTHPKVSILIPVYNRVEMIKSCIDSALNQDYPNLEVIVSDNCSVDGTWELCLRAYKNTSNIKLIRNPTNLGPVANWLAAARAANGKYVKILFSDDLLLDGCVSGMVAQFLDEIGFVYSACLIGSSIDQSRAVYLNHNTPLGSVSCLPARYGLIRYALIVGSPLPVSPGAALFRTSDFISSLTFSLESPASQESLETGAGPDVQIFLDALKSYPFFAHINTPCTFFRSHPDSLSTSSRNNVLRGYDSTFMRFFSNTSRMLLLAYKLKRFLKIIAAYTKNALKVS